MEENNKKITLNYTEIIKNFETILKSKSRGFDTKYEFLEAWVPSDDINDSLSDLLQLSLEYNINDLDIEFDEKNFKIIDRNLILSKFGNLIFNDKDLKIQLNNEQN